MRHELSPDPNPIQPPAFQPHSGGPRVTTVYPPDRSSYTDWCMAHRAEGRGISNTDPNSFWDNIRNLQTWVIVRTFAATHR